jgi:CRP-like cAMP-binding protein
VKCLAISRRDFDQLLTDEPRIAVNMLRSLARRLAETDRMLARG